VAGLGGGFAVRLALLALCVFFLVVDEAHAQEGEAPAASEPLAPVAAPSPAPVAAPSPAPAQSDACTPALERAEALLAAGHKVDAHLIAQTMSFLCASEETQWHILDAVALTHLEEHERAFALLESIALRPGPQAERARVLAAWVLIVGDLG
jgi:hypothetical protein